MLNATRRKQIMWGCIPNRRRAGLNLPKVVGDCGAAERAASAKVRPHLLGVEVKNTSVGGAGSKGGDVVEAGTVTSAAR